MQSSIPLMRLPLQASLILTLGLASLPAGQAVGNSPLAPPVTGKPATTPPVPAPPEPGCSKKTTRVDFKPGNNGWGNGDQTPPGNSGDHNNAENGPGSPPPGIIKKNPDTGTASTEEQTIVRRTK